MGRKCTIATPANVARNRSGLTRRHRSAIYTGYIAVYKQLGIRLTKRGAMRVQHAWKNAPSLVDLASVQPMSRHLGDIFFHRGTKAQFDHVESVRGNPDGSVTTTILMKFEVERTAVDWKEEVKKEIERLGLDPDTRQDPFKPYKPIVYGFDRVEGRDENAESKE